MIKVIPSGSFSFDDPVARLVDVHQGGIDKSWLVKRAAVMTREISGIRPEAGHSYIHLISMGAQEAYGCFVAGTRVRMGDGRSQPIETIELGQEVVSGKGRVRKVSSKYERDYKGRMCHLNISGILDDIECTAGHEFFSIPASQVACLIDSADHCKPDTCRVNSTCQSRNCSRSVVSYHPDYVSADQLRPGDYVLTPIPDRGVGTQTWGWSTAFARVLGYFLAEGSFLKSKKKRMKGLTFCFNANEVETLVVDLLSCIEKMRAEYVSLHATGPYISTLDNTATVHVRSDELAARVFRAVGEYSGEKRLLGPVWSQTPELLCDMLACYLDGDGTCPVYEKPDGYSEHRYTMGTKSKELALDLQWILSRLGCIAAVCPVHQLTPASEPTDFYHVSFSNACGEVFSGKCQKHRSEKPAQVKQHSFLWNGYVCRPVRKVIYFDSETKVYNLEVEEDHTYTVSNGIVVKNSNRNGDGFNEKAAEFQLVEPKRGEPKRIMMAGGLLEYHPTFKKNAHVFKHHKNTDPAQAIGEIAAEAYNPDMRRGELIIKVSNEHPDWRDDIQKLARGEDIPFSMACKVAYDICSYCGNRAKSREGYCDHLKNHMNEVVKSGHQIFAINDVPTFFDISKVFRPADRIAWSLQKVAADTLAPPSGVELAEMLGVSAPVGLLSGGPVEYARKMAAARKLAAIEKLVEGVARGVDNPQVSGLLRGCPVSDISSSDMASLKDAQLGSALRALGSANICLSVRDFARLVMGDEFPSMADDIPKAERMLPSLFSSLLSNGEVEECAADNSYDSCPGDTSISRGLRSLVEKLSGDHSLSDGPVRKRVQITIIRGVNPKLRDSGIKAAAVSKRANALAKEYAKYQLSFVASTDFGQVGNMLTVLGNWRRF